MLKFSRKFAKLQHFCTVYYNYIQLNPNFLATPMNGIQRKVANVHRIIGQHVLLNFQKQVLEILIPLVWS